MLQWKGSKVLVKNWLNCMLRFSVEMVNFWRVFVLARFVHGSKPLLIISEHGTFAEQNS